MSPSEQIAHYAAVRARLWTPKPVQATAAPRVAQAKQEAPRAVMGPIQLTARITVPYPSDRYCPPPAPRPRTGPPTIVEIIEATGAVFGFSQDDIKSHRRTQRLAHARQAAFALARLYTRHSYPEIARRTGGRDHTTALYGERSAAARCLIDETYRDNVMAVAKRLCLDTTRISDGHAFRMILAERGRRLPTDLRGAL